MGIVTGIGGSVLGLMMPVLSGMEDGRKRACWRAIKISLVLVTPPAFILAAYPEVPLGLLGKEYVNAAPMLMLLALTIPATLIGAGVTSLIYAYGMYMTILILGLVGNLSRIAAYVPLSYLMGGVGVALSYVLGAYVALAAAVLVCRRIGFNPGFREALLITALPLCLALILHLLGVSWLIGAPLLLLLSYTSYLKMGILSRGDLKELAYALAPRQTVNEIYQHLRPIIDRLID
jgi:O-antigen/teichoic acid export membrane protein